MNTNIFFCVQFNIFAQFFTKNCRLLVSLYVLLLPFTFIMVTSEFKMFCALKLVCYFGVNMDKPDRVIKIKTFENVKKIFFYIELDLLNFII